jgi:hypothetical protein
MSVDNAHWTYHTNGALPTWARLNANQYFRAALQSGENQATVIADVENDYGVPSFSAIPTYPKDSFNAGVANPYPNSKTAGRALMKRYGWNVNSFPAVCAKSNCAMPGDPSIPKGTKATEQVLVPSGVPSVKTQTLDEAASIKAGSDIQITPKFELATTVQNACFGGNAPWQICGYGCWIYAPDYYPSGEVLFAAGSESPRRLRERRDEPAHRGNHDQRPSCLERQGPEVPHVLRTVQRSGCPVPVAADSDDVRRAGEVHRGRAGTEPAWRFQSRVHHADLNGAASSSYSATPRRGTDSGSDLGVRTVSHPVRTQPMVTASDRPECAVVGRQAKQAGPALAVASEVHSGPQSIARRSHSRRRTGQFADVRHAF